MGVELCSVDDCGKPTEVVLVLVMTSLTGDPVNGPVSAALCGPHSRWMAGIVRRLTGPRAAG